MREIIQLIEQAQQSGDRILRSAFLYLPPTGDAHEFAQCGSCGMYIPGAHRCWLFGDSDVVVANASCGMYIQGEPSNDQEPQSKVTPQDAGYNLGQVRCENCRWLSGKSCALFEMLNRELPQVFDLDPEVEPLACCNAWQKLD
jgi:hypothetical protein